MDFTFGYFEDVLGAASPIPIHTHLHAALRVFLPLCRPAAPAPSRQPAAAAGNVRINLHHSSLPYGGGAKAAAPAAAPAAATPAPSVTTAAATAP